jgi:hypothetical protein
MTEETSADTVGVPPIEKLQAAMEQAGRDWVAGLTAMNEAIEKGAAEARAKRAAARSITVHEIGTAVTIAGDVPAMILRVQIDGADVSYEVAWWNGRSRSTAWLLPAEIEATVAPGLRIGFRG